jgi:thymidine kinase
VARLEVITGPMFSGKSEELIRRLRRAAFANQSILLCNPASDDRETRNIFDLVNTDKKLSGYQHLFRAKIAAVQDLEEALNNKPQILAIDEIQFLFLNYSVFDFLVDLLEKERNSDFLIITSGLNLDADGRSFGVMPEFMAKADDISLLSAVCVTCGNSAIFTQKKPGGSQKQIEVGGENLYEARCRKCFIKQSLLPHQ